MKRVVLPLIIAFLSIIPAASGVKRGNVLIVPFKNQSAPQYSWISGGMTETIIADLRRTGAVNVFSEEDRKKALREIEIAMTGITGTPDSDTGKIMGADLICSGSYTVSGNDVRVVARLTEVATSKTERAVKVDGKLDRILDLQDRIVSLLMEEAGSADLSSGTGIKFSDDHKKRALARYRPAVKAFELYSKALEKSESDTKGALALAKGAINADREYISPAILAAIISTNSGDVKSASKYFDDALKIAGTSKGISDAERGGLYYAMALNLWNRGEYRTSLGYSLEAVQLLQKSGEIDSAFGASVLVIQGASERALGENEAALSSTLRAKGILEKNGLVRTSNYAWTLSNLGVIYTQTGENDRAIQVYNEANSIWSSIGLKRSMGYAFTYSQIGSAYYSKGDYAGGIKFLTEGMELCRDLSLENTVQYAYYAWNLANCYWMTGKYCDGVPHIQKAAAVFRSLGSATLQQAEKAHADFRRQCGK